MQGRALVQAGAGAAFCGALSLQALAYRYFFGYVEVDRNTAQRVLASVLESYTQALRPVLTIFAKLAGAVGLQLA